MRIPITLAGAGPRVARSEGELRAFLRELCERNVRMMRKSPRSFPPLKETRVRYRREPRGVEQWQDAAQLLARGIGDCEDLAAYETARLAIAGKHAQALLSRSNVGWHVTVLVDGQKYDPSRMLGM